MPEKAIPSLPEVPCEEAIPSTPPVIDSATLLKGGSEIVILHGRREYRLRRTRFDKLILTA